MGEIKFYPININNINIQILTQFLHARSSCRFAMVLTRAAFKNQIDKDLEYLTQLDDVHCNVKPLVTDFVFALKDIINKYELEAVSNIVPLVSECLGKLSDSFFNVDYLQGNLSDALNENGILVNNFKKEKENYNLLLETAIEEEERNRSLVEELAEVKKTTSFANSSCVTPQQASMSVPVTPTQNLIQTTLQNVTASLPHRATRVFYANPTVVRNRFEVLSDLPDSDLSSTYTEIPYSTKPLSPYTRGKKQLSSKSSKAKDSSGSVKQYKITSHITREPQTVEKRTVLLVSDSHGRGMSKMLSQQLGPGFSVTSVVRPGAPAQHVVHDIASLTQGFSSNDIVIVIGGTNDVDSETEFSVSDILKDKLSSVSKPAIVLSTVPYRYDRALLNHKINAINKAICTSMTQQNVEFFDINGCLRKRHYTRHGLHMTDSGKFRVCAALADCIKQCKVSVAEQLSSGSESDGNVFEGNTFLEQEGFLEKKINTLPLSREMELSKAWDRQETVLSQD
jgi:hypothetical protein